MKRFRKMLSILMAVVLLAGFMLIPGHAAAQESLQPGDINGDGKINVGDVSRIYSHVRGVRLITDEDALSRADVTGDGKLNIGDAARAYSMVRNTTPSTPSKTDVTLKVWVPAPDMEVGWLSQMQQQFQKAHPEYNITWINEACCESDAGSFVSADPVAAADVYMFANDQLGTLVNAGGLTALDGQYLDQVLTDNSGTMVNTVTHRDDQVYGFPVTNNTWFMYYNKVIFSEEDVKSLDTMLTKGKVAFDWGNGWYAGAFFLANGGQIFGEKGNDPYAGIQFGADNGGYEAALKMVQLADNPNMVTDSNRTGYMGLLDGTIGAFFSGSWDYLYLSEGLGDRLGIVQLPTVEIDGQQKQMKAFAGSKAVGVNPHADNQAAAMEFAAYLSSVEGQKLRYQLRDIIPAATVLAQDPEVATNPVAVAEINTINNTSVVQPTIPEMSSYWAPIGNFGGMIVNESVTVENYREEVDLMMDWLNSYEIYEPEVPEVPEGPDIPLPPPVDGTPITLQVWAPYEDQTVHNNWLVRMENSFQQAHPEYSITWINEGCSEGDAGSYVSVDPAAAADVYMFANDQLATLKNAGALTALEGQYLDQVLADNSETLVNTVTHTDDQVYAFPIANNTWFMYYNKDVFTEEDVKSLDTMLTKGKVAFQWGTGWYNGTFFLANGGQIFGEKGNDASAGIQFGENNGGYEAALKMVQLAANPNFKEETYLGPSGLIDGSVDAYFSGSWDYASLKESLGDNLGAAQLPTVEIDGQQKQMKAFAGSKAVGVNPHADNQALAMEFASHLASVEGQKLRYQLRGVIPAAKALANDPEVAANPVAVAEINTMNNTSVVQPSLPEMSNYWSPMGNFGAMVVNGEINNSNYKAHVDLMMAQFGNAETPEEYEIANIQLAAGGVIDRTTLRIHYDRPDGDYTGWNVWLWDARGISVTPLNPPYQFEEIDGEMVCTVEINPGTSQVGYIIRLEDWLDQDIHEDQFIDLTGILCGTVDVYIESGIRGHRMVLNDDVVYRNIPRSLEYKHSKQQLILGLSALPEQTPVMTLTGSNGSVAITSMTRAGTYYYLTLEEPLAPGHYTLTCDIGWISTITFDII